MNGNGEDVTTTAQNILRQREAANWLAQTRERFVGMDTTNLSLEQLKVVKKFADEMVSRLYAEIWGRESGKVVPPYNGPGWNEFYDEWLASE